MSSESKPRSRPEAGTGLDHEAPEADALEQARSVDGDEVDRPPTPSIAPDVPEADAIEQSIEVANDDGYEPHS